MAKVRPVRLETLKDLKDLSGKSGRSCDHPECKAEGLHRAPKSRKHLREYYWFCREHAERYNRAWNFHAGMGAEEIEAHLRAAVIGERPLWPLGTRGDHGWRYLRYANGRDPFQMFEEKRSEPPRANGREKGARPASTSDRARATLGLTEGADTATIKKQYKRLVKQYHPDANGGDKRSEEHLKRINEAYSVLKKQWAS
jgi:DnaJ-domain-containing protein 1